MDDSNNINNAIASLNSNNLLRVILEGNKSFDKKTNREILTTAIKFRKDAQRFEKSLF